MIESYKDIADSLHLLSDWTVDDLCKESIYVRDICEEGSGIIKEMMEKLAAYEDTGLTPETCKDIKSLCDDYVDAGLDASFILACIAAARAGISSKSMTEISKAETDNRLIILPCKVGDTLFFAQVGREEPFSMRVQGMSISASGNDVILHFGGFPITNAWGSEVGKTLYLTREEAEAALKGESKDV